MMWTDSVMFPISDKATKDADGFVTNDYKYSDPVPANFKSLSRRDIETANQVGYDVVANVDVLACNYNGQRFCIDGETGDMYYIQRTFKQSGKNVITLTLGLRDRGEKNGCIRY